MENPIKMDDLGVPLFLETPNINFFIANSHLLTILSLRGPNQSWGPGQESWLVDDVGCGYGSKIRVSFVNHYLWV